MRALRAHCVRPHSPPVLVHGVFAPISEHGARVTPAGRGRGGQHVTTADPEEPTPGERRAAMILEHNGSSGSSASTTCPTCGGAVRIIACIAGLAVIEKILAHPNANAGEPEASLRPPRRGPPRAVRRDRMTCDKLIRVVASVARCWRPLSSKLALWGKARWRHCRADEFGGARPNCALMGEPAWPANGRCPRRSGGFLRHKPTNTWLILSICPCDA